MNGLFDTAREGFLLSEIDYDGATIKVALVRGYTYNAAHKFVSDVTGAGGVLAASVTLASKTGTNGIADAADVSSFGSPAANANPHSYLIYQSSAVTGGADVATSAQRVIAWLDGSFRFTVAAAALSGATSLAVDPILAAIANGATLTKISGTGPTTITMGASATANARTLTVSATSAAVGVDAVYEVPVSGANIPIPSLNGGDVSLTWDNGANKIFKL